MTMKALLACLPLFVACITAPDGTTSPDWPKIQMALVATDGQLQDLAAISEDVELSARFLEAAHAAGMAADAIEGYEAGGEIGGVKQALEAFLVVSEPLMHEVDDPDAKLVVAEIRSAVRIALIFLE